MPTTTSVVAFDVETTGLTNEDRVVSLGMIRVDLPSEGDDIDLRYLHVVCDPGRKSHPKAEQVHGWSDWELRHQDKFADHAKEVISLLDGATAVLAHHTAFDKAFVARELELAGHQIAWPSSICTMTIARERGWPASLNALAARYDLYRSSSIHGALEDAWLALSIWFKILGNNIVIPRDPFIGRPTNFRTSPPKRAHAPSREKYEPVADLWRSVGPLLVLLVPLATADGGVTKQEVAALRRIVQQEAELEGKNPDQKCIESVVYAALAGPASDDELKQAAQWYAQEQNRPRLATFAEELIRADGRTDVKEVEVLRHITDLFL